MFNKLKDLLEKGKRTVSSFSDKYNPLDSDFRRNVAPQAKQEIVNRVVNPVRNIASKTFSQAGNIYGRTVNNPRVKEFAGRAVINSTPFTQAVSPVLNKIPNLGQKLVDTSKNFAKDTARDFVRLPMSFQIKKDFTPTTRLEKVLLGDTKVEPITNNKVSRYLESKGYSPTASKFGSVGLGVVGMAGNLTGTGSGKSKIAQALTKIDDVARIRGLTKNLRLGDDAIEAIAKSKNVDEIDNLLRGKVAKPVDALSNEAKKYNWYRGETDKGTGVVGGSSGDKFYSADKYTAGDYGKVKKLSSKELPKNPLIVDSKDDLVDAIGYRGDPFNEPIGTKNNFDDMAKKYAQGKGHDGIIYRDGTLNEPELHMFSQPLSTTPKTTIETKMTDQAPLLDRELTGLDRKQTTPRELESPGLPESRAQSSNFDRQASFDNTVPQNSEAINGEQSINTRKLSAPQERLMLPEGTITTNNKAEYLRLKALGKKVEFVNNLKPGEEAINLTSESRLLNPETSKQEVVANLQKKFDDFERGVYGSATSELKGGAKGAGLISRVTRPIQEKASTLVGKGLESQNTLVRGISRGIRGLFGGSGNTAEITNRLGGYRGGVQSAENLANDFQKLGDTMLPDKLSREKVWSFLDPEMATVKVTEKDLSPSELEAVKVLRQASDLINDTNFVGDHISHETWLKGRDGKYITRAYEDFDLPPELSGAFSGGKGKLDLGAYKQRTDVDDWKQENAIKDPFYLASKRIQSTYQNKAITDYSSWISKQQGLVSDVEKAGYTQLSDSKMWGDLSGKYVRKDILEGIRGFYFDSKALQGAYDALNWYDKNPVRQLLKKTKTVYNPATRLGNQTSNRIFAVFNGINPITFEKNIQTFAKGELKNNGQYARLLRQRGVLGNDMTKYELVKSLAKEGVEPGKLKKMDDFVAGSYGAADEHAKLAAFKYWLDKGKTVDEAVIKVRNGFQDYSKVGLYYDVMSKLPLVGKPFVRFQSELIRIIKNSALENPLGLGTVVGSIALMGYASSKLWAKESDKDRETRENRFGVPVIPFTNIPLVFQTPYGEVNVARMFGMYETAGADTKNKNVFQRVSKYLPADIPTNAEDLKKTMGNDVMLGGIVNLINDSDFRGKSITDPNQNKYQPTTLTKGEQRLNQLKYLGYNYNLPVVNDLINIGQAATGNPDQYGNKKTVKQAVSKLTGLKVNQFGPEEAQAQRIKDAEFSDRDREFKQKQENAITKQLLSGQIDQKTADKRISNLYSSEQTNKVQASGDNRKQKGTDGWKVYLNGELKTFDNEAKADEAIFKDDLKSSDKKSGEFNDRFYYKQSDGDIGSIPLAKRNYNVDISKVKLDIEKSEGNKSNQLKLYEKQAKIIEDYANTLDPEVDVDEINNLTVQVENLKDKYASTQKSIASAANAKIKKAKTKKEAEYSLNVDKYKRSNNLSGWLSATQSHIKYLEDYANNTSDETEQLRIENKINDLISQAEKYQEQGGFTKPKKIKLYNPFQDNSNDIASKTYQNLNRLLAGTSAPQAPRSTTIGRKVTLRKRG